MEDKKTLDEIFHKHSHKDNGGEYMYFSHFVKCVRDYKQSIIGLIELEIGQKKEVRRIAGLFPMTDIDKILIGKYNYYIDELTELKGKIEQL